MRPFAPLALALILAAPACAIDDTADDDGGGRCAGKCDDAGPKKGLLYAPQYTHSTSWAGDGRYGLAQAQIAADLLEARGWESVEVVSVDGLDAMLADLDTRGDREFDLVGTVSHATRGGPVLRDATGTRNTVQAGWTWFGPDEPISTLANGGPVDLDGLLELTTRLQRVTHPEGKIVFSGCRTGSESIASAPRDQPVNSAYAEGTPFFIPDETPARRYKTYVHAIADLTGRVTAGSKVRMNLDLTDDVLETIYYGGEHGTGGLPRFYISVMPAGGKADEIAEQDRSYTFDEAEGTYVASGSCDETTGECDTADASWDRDE